MDLSLGQDLAETFAQAFHRFIEKQVRGTAIEDFSALLQTDILQASNPVCIFVPKFRSPFSVGWLPLKELPLTRAHRPTRGRLSVGRRMRPCGLTAAACRRLFS